MTNIEQAQFMIWFCWVMDRLHGMGTVVWWPGTGRP